MSIEELILLGKDMFVERIAKTLLSIMAKGEVPSGEALVVPELYSIRFYDDLIVYGELIAYGDVEVS